MKLIAKESFVYATRRLLPGDVFRVRPCDAGVLRLVGKAVDVVVTEPAIYASVAEEPKKPKRKYTRRKKKEPEAGPTEVGQE